MIKNERQYRITAAEADRFEKALAARPSTPPPGSGVHPRLWDAERDGLASQLAELRQDIAAYDALRAGNRRVFGVGDLGEIPRAIIEGRIAMGLTQKDLGERLDLPEQAIQRYEATNYASASLDRIRQVATAIGMELSGLMALSETEPTPQRFFQRLAEIGIDRRLVLDRLVSPTVAALLSAPTKANELVAGALLQAAAVVQRVFDVEPTALFGGGPISLNCSVTATTRFKRPRRSGAVKPQGQRADAYTVFAHFLALLVLEVTKHIPRRAVPSTPNEWRSTIITEFGSLNFPNVVRFFWSVGIPVLPLRDAGVFHGACWRSSGREVVVLKQRSASEDRWTHDALHEGGHIVGEPSAESFSIIVEEVPSPDDPAERFATQFAANIVLDGRADELAERAVKLASGNVQFLERAARRVASEADVSLGALANYLAFRIAIDTADEGQPINWWGTANRLQRQTDDPWRIARDLLLNHADLSRLNPADRDILVRALSELNVDATSTRIART